MKTFHFEVKDGPNILAVFDADIHKDIPQDNVLEVSDEDWQLYLQTPKLFRIENGALVAYTPPLPSPEEQAKADEILRQSRIREDINANAGDMFSVLGTTSDMASIALLGAAALVSSIDEGTSFPTFKAAFLGKMQALSGSQDMVAISNTLLTKIGSGEVAIPVISKGIEVAMADIETRNTAISAAITSTE